MGAGVSGEDSGFLVPPAFWEEAARNMPGWTWDRRAPDDPQAITARKLESIMIVPNELLMDYGVIPDTRPAPPPPTWRHRWRRKWEQWRESAARRAYKIIAGDWPHDGGDDW